MKTRLAHVLDRLIVAIYWLQMHTPLPLARLAGWVEDALEWADPE